KRDANAFHQVLVQNLWGRPLPGICIHRSAVHGVATRRVAAVSPIQKPVPEIELKVDGLWQAIVQHLDIGAIDRVFTLWDLDVRSKEPAESPLLRAFLRPVDVPALGI